MKPEVSIFIPTYLDHNDKYLNTAVKSVLSQDIDLELIIVSDRKKHPEFKDERVRVIKLDKRIRFSAKNNLAAREASKDSKFFLLLNDDTLLSQKCLTEMVKTAKAYQERALVGAISNCDNGPLWHSILEVPLEVGKLPISPQMTFDEVSPWFDSLSLYQPYSKFFAFEVPRLFFYNILIPRSAWNDIGEMDENFQNSCEDFDYCIRAKMKGYRLIIQQSAFCFHFSGKTSGVTAISKERIEDQLYIEKKHKENYVRIL